MALVKTPKSIAPWPPETKDKRAVTVTAKDSLGDLATKNGMSLRDLLLLNFRVDMETERDWAFHVNWYLREKLRCTRLTAGGNYMFSGGETIYVAQAPSARTPKATLHDLTTVIGVKRWFLEDVVPLRTVGKGHLGHNVARYADVLFGADADAGPNGLCGEAAFLVQQLFLEARTGDPYSDQHPVVEGFVLGQVLWNGFNRDDPTSTPNHTAAILCPNFGAKIFTKNLTNTETVDITPPKAGGRTHPYASLVALPVLDLYRMELSTLDKWWRDCSWFGWGRLTIDSTRYRNTLEG